MNYCHCGLAKWWGQQEFAVPQNVLEIVYGQTICWIGTFYCPLLPAINTVKYILVFYLKKVTTQFSSSLFQSSVTDDACFSVTVWEVFSYQSEKSVSV